MCIATGQLCKSIETLCFFFAVLLRKKKIPMLVKDFLQLRCSIGSYYLVINKLFYEVQRVLLAELVVVDTVVGGKLDDAFQMLLPNVEIKTFIAMGLTII
jgi:hypothetical protein